MQFVYQALTWGFLLALVPLLIHLINMMRHKRVQWAAMEFLLASYKKHRQWIWLKQLLLLLARMAVVALVVAMLAQLKTRDQWLALFGNRITHHYVLLDDSYSMTDRAAGASAFDAAQQVITNIINRAKGEDSPQRFTLLRFSRARGAASGKAAGTAAEHAAQRADFNAEPVDGSFDVTLETKQQTLEPTALSLGPLEALALLKQLLSQANDETSVVYLLSDFRAREWSNPAEIKSLLAEVKRHKADIHLVSCQRSSEPNLGIVELAATEDTRAAGVPLFVRVKVKNFGSQQATKVQLKLRSTFYPPGDAKTTAPEQLKGIADDLGTVVLDKIDPGETVTRRVQVYFPQHGQHVVEATLAEDPVDADNHRWCVIDFPEGEKVLVLDGSANEQHRYYLEIAFRPLEKSNTGIRPQAEPLSYLRDATAETLQDFTAIYLLDVPSLEERSAALLEDYVRGGGGLAFFGGPNVNVAYYNKRLYNDGQGLFPAPLAAALELPPAVDTTQPDINLARHPIFSFFVEQTNPLIRGVRVDQYLHVDSLWKPEPNSGVDILARLRNGSPLILEKKLGQGTVVAVLTTLAPQWNDWAKNPSIVVTVLKMQAYLATNQRLDDARLVGTPLAVNLEAGQFRNNVAFIRPGDAAGTRVKIDRQAGAPDQGSTTIAASLESDPSRRISDETDRPGIYEAWPTTIKGDIDLRRWALNVDPAEGDLTTIPSADLLARLEPVQVNYHQADQYQQDEAIASGYNLSQMIMIALVALLLGEQLLAYSASYHPQPGGRR